MNPFIIALVMGIVWGATLLIALIIKSENTEAAKFRKEWVESRKGDY